MIAPQFAPVFHHRIVQLEIGTEGVEARIGQDIQIVLLLHFVHHQLVETVLVPLLGRIHQLIDLAAHAGQEAFHPEGFCHVDKLRNFGRPGPGVGVLAHHPQFVALAVHRDSLRMIKEVLGRIRPRNHPPPAWGADVPRSPVAVKMRMPDPHLKTEGR